MSVQTVRYKGNLASANTERFPSQAIWGDCPWEKIRDGEIIGTTFWDDFDDLPLAPTLTTQIAYGRYKAFATTGATISGVSVINAVEQSGGILAFAMSADNDGISLANAYPSVRISGAVASSSRVWLEARCCFSPVTTNGLGWILGLAEVEQWTLATTVPLNAGDAINNSASFIGFRKPEDDTTTADTVYSDRATSFTNVGDAELTGLAAYTWFKIGLVYDATDATNCVRFFLNNIELTTKVSRSTITGLTNLDVNNLGLILAAIADSSGTTAVFYMDWWKLASTYPLVSPA